MQIRTKSSLLIILGTLAFAIAFATVAWYLLRTSLLHDLGLQSQMGAELIRLTVTHEMDEGSTDHIGAYLDRLSDLPGLKKAHVVPGESVVKQHQLDLSKYEAASELELKVLETGKSAHEIIEGDNPVFHYAIPYIASRKGVHNCLRCHDASEGEVLGVVSLEIDITDPVNVRNHSVLVILALVFLFGIIMAVALRRLMRPILQTTLDLKQAIAKAEAGNFTVRLRKSSDDEAGEIAEETNRFMQSIENSFGQIAKEVESLTGVAGGSSRGNLLEKTVQVVQNLVRASQFKQAIESDRDLAEVYERLERALVQQFGFNKYSIYEISNSQNRLRLVAAQELPEGAELWCTQEVLVDCAACRAKRTAEMVSSYREPQMCAAFAGNKVQSAQNLMHVCIPIMLSGSVGGVLQIIFTEEEYPHVQEVLPTLQGYLDEAAPVIESKRLMKSLKDASLHDQMTGLYNRRFLEEYLQMLLTGAERKGAKIGLLMCDVDFFKQVNDTLGHAIGDTVLKGVAGILKKSVRASDLVVRFGGEEFLAVLVDVQEEKLAEIAEKLRKSVEEHVFQTAQGPLGKTISIGTAVYPLDGEDFWECIKFADVALYEAKESGRNKVVRFSHEMWADEQNSKK